MCTYCFLEVLGQNSWLLCLWLTWRSLLSLRRRASLYGYQRPIFIPYVSNSGIMGWSHGFFLAHSTHVQHVSLIGASEMVTLPPEVVCYHLSPKFIDLTSYFNFGLTCSSYHQVLNKRIPPQLTDEVWERTCASVIVKKQGKVLLNDKQEKALLRRALDVLMEEPNVLMIPGPVTVWGDIRGENWPTFRELFFSPAHGLDDGKKHLFLGNYVKSSGLKVLNLLLALKIKYPSQLFLLRGNHECHQLTQVYGFQDECKAIYGNHRIWTEACKIFNALPLAAVVANSVFCVHGGLSPDLHTLDDITRLERCQPIQYEGILTDLMWSDANDEEGADSWQVSPRGAGWLFGPEATKKFLKKNRLKCMIRSHQCVLQEPWYKWDHDGKCCTIFSCPNLAYRCGNQASVAHIDHKGDITFSIFDIRKERKCHRETNRLLPNFDDQFVQETGEFLRAPISPEFKDKHTKAKPSGYPYGFL